MVGGSSTLLDTRCSPMRTDVLSCCLTELDNLRDGGFPTLDVSNIVQH